MIHAPDREGEKPRVARRTTRATDNRAEFAPGRRDAFPVCRAPFTPSRTWRRRGRARRGRTAGRRLCPSRTCSLTQSFIRSLFDSVGRSGSSLGVQSGGGCGARVKRLQYFRRSAVHRRRSRSARRAVYCRNMSSVSGTLNGPSVQDVKPNLIELASIYLGNS